jgi:tRNA pseudouridine55 synthase
MALDEKEYLATMRLGVATETGDLTGAPRTAVSDARHLTAGMVEEALAHFRGQLDQLPPMYSAKKVAGVKLYELARRGEEIERRPVTVEIKVLELCAAPDLPSAPVVASPVNAGQEPDNAVSEEGAAMTRDFSFRVVCSAGTYVRTLAEEIGERLGVGAHLTQLRRLRAGNCGLKQGVTLERLAELTDAGLLDETVIPMGQVITLEELRISGEEGIDIGHGRPLKSSGKWLNGTMAKLCDYSGNLLAIAQYDADRQLWRPRVVLTAG